MRFIRKNGRVIPIADKARGGSPTRTQKTAAAGAAAFVGGNVLAQHGAQKFTANVYRAQALMKKGKGVDYWKAVKGARKGVAMIATGTVAGAVGAGLLAVAGISALRKRKTNGQGK